jgi:transcriptional regulator with XRE-family HTH domain
MELNVKNPNLIAFGKQLKIMRIERDISRKQLADATGLSVSFLGAVERGERGLSIACIVTIGKFFKISHISIQIL